MPWPLDLPPASRSSALECHLPVDWRPLGLRLFTFLLPRDVDGGTGRTLAGRRARQCGGYRQTAGKHGRASVVAIVAHGTETGGATRLRTAVVATSSTADRPP